jgi:hypothetical protein
MKPSSSVSDMQFNQSLGLSEILREQIHNIFDAKNRTDAKLTLASIAARMSNHDVDCLLLHGHNVDGLPFTGTTTTP